MAKIIRYGVLAALFIQTPVLGQLEGSRNPSREATFEPHTIGPGSFLGQPLVTLLPGHKVRLEKAFGFRDLSGEWWPVPSKFKSDGASIPRAFWSVVGGPLDGPYRDAAIVHDYYCDKMTKPWRAVHRMFYDAMIASGVAETDAKIKYYAVYRFGPRWTFYNGKPRRCGFLGICKSGGLGGAIGGQIITYEESADGAVFEEDLKRVEQLTSLADIEHFADVNASRARAY